MQGRFVARAVAWGITRAGKNGDGKERAEVKFQLKDQPVQRVYHGYFTENTAERTLQSLEYCGWDGVSLRAMNGMGTRDVELVIEEEIFEGKTRDVVRWVNEIKPMRVAADDDIAALEARVLKNRKPKTEETFDDPFA